MTFIDVIAGTAIMLVVFLGIFGAFKLSLELVYNTKARTGGVSLVTERMEYVRSLSYDAIGTVGGIPAGTIPQVATDSMNGVLYTLRTLIEYEDAPEDGLDDLDENGITADYKIIKVESLWSVHGSSRSVFAVSRIAPHGIETIVGGGTLRVNVINSFADAIQGASVRVENPDLDPAVDVTVSTNSKGSITLPGAPSASSYKISVSKTGYTGAQTYDATAGNPNPNPGHVAVVEGVTSTITLSIDKVASLFARTFKVPGPGAFDDLFDDESNLSAHSGVAVTGGVLQLADDGAGAYVSSGSATSNTVSPAYLASWDEVTFEPTTPLGTVLTVQVFYHNGTEFVLVPDEAIPGNSVGLSGGSIGLSSLPAQAYGQLRLFASLSTEDPAATPSLASWSISYIAGPTPLGDIDFHLRGTKTIGTTGGGLPIFKLDQDYETDQYGEWHIDPMEADAYTVVMNEGAYDVAERCPYNLSVAPESAATLVITLDDKTTNSLILYVEGGGMAVPNASVTLTGPETQTGTTSACGQVFFPNLTAGNYAAEVVAAGFTTQSNAVSVSGTTDFSVTLIAP